MTLDLTRPFQCRNGAQAGATTGPDGRLYGWVKSSDGVAVHDMIWMHDGAALWFGDGPRYRTADHSLDLINIPQHHTLDVWVNVYDDGDMYLHLSRESAEDGIVPETKRIACVHIQRDFEDGDGL